MTSGYAGASEGVRLIGNGVWADGLSKLTST